MAFFQSRTASRHRRSRADNVAVQELQTNIDYIDEEKLVPSNNDVEINANAEDGLQNSFTGLPPSIWTAVVISCCKDDDFYFFDDDGNIVDDEETQEKVKRISASVKIYGLYLVVTLFLGTYFQLLIAQDLMEPLSSAACFTYDLFIYWGEKPANLTMLVNKEAINALAKKEKAGGDIWEDLTKLADPEFDDAAYNWNVMDNFYDPYYYGYFDPDFDFDDLMNLDPGYFYDWYDEDWYNYDFDWEDYGDDSEEITEMSQLIEELRQKVIQLQGEHNITAIWSEEMLENAVAEDDYDFDLSDDDENSGDDDDDDDDDEESSDGRVRRLEMDNLRSEFLDFDNVVRNRRRRVNADAQNKPPTYNHTEFLQLQTTVKRLDEEVNPAIVKAGLNIVTVCCVIYLIFIWGEILESLWTFIFAFHIIFRDGLLGDVFGIIKAVFMVILFGIRVVIINYLSFVGIKFVIIASEGSASDLILNCLAITFLVELPGALYDILADNDLKECVENLEGQAEEFKVDNWADDVCEVCEVCECECCKTNPCLADRGMHVFFWVPVAFCLILQGIHSYYTCKQNIYEVKV